MKERSASTFPGLLALLVLLLALGASVWRLVAAARLLDVPMLVGWLAALLVLVVQLGGFFTVDPTRRAC